MHEYVWPIIVTLCVIFFFWALYRDWKFNKDEKEAEKESWVISVDGYGKYHIKFFPKDCMGWGMMVSIAHDSLESAEKYIENIKEERTKSIRKYVKTVE